MKILMAHHIFSEYGGGEKLLYDEATLLRSNGHEVYFFATNKKPFLEDNYPYEKYFPEYTDFHSLSTFQRLRKFPDVLYNTEVAKLFDKYLDDICPDIVHCHNIFYYLTPSIIDVCKKKKIPIVMTLHDSRMACPSATLRIRNMTYCHKELCVTRNALHCLINKCKYNSYAASFIVMCEYLFHRWFKLFDYVSLFLCPSHAMINLLEKSGIDQIKLALLNNFIDQKYFEKTPSYTNEGYFLYVGRLTIEKGVTYLLDAMSQASRDMQLYIVGEGPEESNLKKQAGQLNLQNVTFLGYQSGESLENIYKNCIATILPSDWFETFGLTIVESFAYGKPVICSNIGGMPEIVESGINGFTFTLGNTQELKHYLEILFINSTLVEKLGKNARKKAELLYHPSKHLQELESIYKKICS